MFVYPIFLNFVLNHQIWCANIFFECEPFINPPLHNSLWPFFQHLNRCVFLLFLCFVALAVRTNLAIPSTSLFSEKTWSHAGKIFSKECEAQLPITFQQHLYTNINQTQYEQYENNYRCVLVIISCPKQNILYRERNIFNIVLSDI